jgi:hypothetical protein
MFTVLNREYICKRRRSSLDGFVIFIKIICVNYKIEVENVVNIQKFSELSGLQALHFSQKQEIRYQRP